MNRTVIVSAWLAVALAGCAKSEDPSQGSQTHFLSTCDDSCAAPYDCICGVCTLACEQDDTCMSEAAGAQCIAASAACGAISSVCDVECTRDDDCASLSSSHTCESGHCRAPGSDDGGSGGSGGTGGTSGTSGMGGTGGTAGVSGTGGMGGTGGGDPEPRGPICDGSTDMRLGYSADGGFVPTSFYFTNPYGHWFLFIDGQCNYFASMNTDDGIASGTLDAAQAEDLAQAIGWDTIQELAGDDVETCPDAGTDNIWAPDELRVMCTCGCDEGALKQRKTDALAYVRNLMDALSQGAKLTGPVAAIAYTSSPVGGEEVWPLDTPIADTANLVQSMDGPITAFALFEDADDAAALRALRDTKQPGTPLLVSDGTGTYDLYVRDELPDDVAAAIESLRNYP